jgi:hypothetical protein
MTSARPVPFSPKCQRRAARAALVARCVTAHPAPAFDLLAAKVALWGFVLTWVLL